MRHCILSVFLLVASIPAHAQDAPPALPAALDISGVPGLIASKVGELKGCGILSLAAKPGGGAYLPIWTWHTASGIDLVEFPTLGYRAIEGQKPNLFSTITVNLPGLSEQWFGGQWFRTFVKKSVFPPIFFGPALMLPLDLGQVRSARFEDWQQYVGVVVSVRLAPAK